MWKYQSNLIWTSFGNGITPHLHEKLRERYEFQNGKPFITRGTMTYVKGGPKWLYPLLKLAVRWKFENRVKAPTVYMWSLGNSIA